MKEAVEDDDFSVLGIEPLLAERPLYTDATAGGIALYFAPRPFNLRRGADAARKMNLITIPGASPRRVNSILPAQAGRDGPSTFLS